MKSGFKWFIAFIRMTRPLQILAVTLVYLLGLVIAISRTSSLEVDKAIWGYLVLIPAVFSIHLANEFSDFETDRLTSRTMFSGGSGALPDMGLNPLGALLLAYLWLVVTGAITLVGRSTGYLSSVSSLVLWIGVLAGWAYSIPPWRLAWRGWGEFLNAILGGLMLPLYGSTIIMARMDFSVLLVMMPFALLTFNNLLATSYADRLADYSVGKYTLATRHNRTHLRAIYLSVLFSAITAILLLPPGLMPSSVKWLSLLAGPAAIWGWRSYTFRENPLPSVTAMSVFLVMQLVGFLVESELYHLFS